MLHVENANQQRQSFPFSWHIGATYLLTRSVCWWSHGDAYGSGARGVGWGGQHFPWWRWRREGWWEWRKAMTVRGPGNLLMSIHYLHYSLRGRDMLTVWFILPITTMTFYYSPLSNQIVVHNFITLQVWKSKYSGDEWSHTVDEVQHPQYLFFHFSWN